MKIFYKKDFCNLMIRYIETQEQIKELKTSYENKINERQVFIDDLQDTLQDRTEYEYSLEQEIDVLKQCNDNLQENLSNSISDNNILKAEIEDLKKKLEESMSDKYLVRKIRAQKAPTQKTRITKTVKSNIRNYMQKEFD